MLTRPPRLSECLAKWEADHADLHTFAAMRRGLDRHFTERFFDWTPNLYAELGRGLEAEERGLIEAGDIRATGFVYVGTRRH